VAQGPKPPFEIEGESSSAALVESAQAEIWWATWQRKYKSQIDTYNEEVAKNGLWSDGLRLF
jgi:hypothetical protein